ncbi:MAG: hypothetical protein OEY38_22105, partial [Gammaproteobacteria bacterium]|nr:hypothetical protein [Gammaproteobacteria bacterium]
FNVPLMRGKVQKQLRGHLLGKGPKLAKDGEIYPYMEWNTEIKEATIDKVGIYTYTSNENLTACLGEGIELRPKSLEMWGPPTKYKKEPIDSDNNT